LKGEENRRKKGGRKEKNQKEDAKGEVISNLIKF
jgi:hypothetical protein